MEPTNCKYCNTEFKPNRKTHVYCCVNCRWLGHVEKDRSKHNESVRKYRAKRYKEVGKWRDEGPKSKALKKWMIELKSEPCTDCGQKFPVCCMDFDHKPGTTKSYNLGSMFAHHYSKELIQTELDKCELVCSNCHRIRTQNRRTGSGKHK